MFLSIVFTMGDIIAVYTIPWEIGWVAVTKIVYVLNSALDTDCGEITKYSDWSDGTGWIATNGGGGPLSMSMSLTPAQLNDLNANPITFIPAPGPNKFINIHRVAATYTFVTQNYRHAIQQNDLYFSINPSYSIALMTFNAANTLWVQSWYSVKRPWGSTYVDNWFNTWQLLLDQPAILSFWYPPIGWDSLIDIKAVYTIEEI